MKPTVNITRVPRSLDDMVHWKCSEFRNFLLHWGVPILRSVLRELHFFHFCLLVQGIYLLSKDRISATNIDLAERSLLMFVENCEQLYTGRILTMNFHQLVHLAQNVLANGPLFANNCFVFEDFNGYIVHNIHGTQSIDTPIVNTINLVQAIPVLSEKYLRLFSDEWCYYADLMKRTMKNRTFVTDDLCYIGKPFMRQLTQVEYEAVNVVFSTKNISVKCYLRVFVKGDFVVYGTDYKQLSRRNQSAVKVKGPAGWTFGLVKYFAQFSDTSEVTRNVAIMTPLEKIETLCSGVSHEVVCNQQKAVEVVCSDSIVCSCIYAQTDNRAYICEFPNNYGGD